jgi:hypothetical protein
MLTVVFALLTQGSDYVEKDPRAHERKVRAMAHRARGLPPSRLEGRLNGLSPETVEMLMRELSVIG